MFDEENPWSDWLGDGVFAHPNAPCRGGGFRRRPGIHDHRGCAVNPFSPAGRYLNPREAAQGYAEFELERILRRLFFCHEPSELPSIAREAFGHDSFSERFSQALAMSPPASRFFALQRMMVQAELYDHLQGPVGAVGWQPPFRFSTVVSPKLREVGHYLRFGSGMHTHEELQKAATTRDALLKELAALFAQPVKVFEEARAKLPSEAREYWNLYNDLVRSGGNRTDAGHALGFVMAKALTALSELQRRGDVQSRLTGAAPLLAKYGQMINEISGASSALGENTVAMVKDSGRKMQAPNTMEASPPAEMKTFGPVSGDAPLGLPRKALSAPEWPDLPANDAPNFNSAEPKLIPEGKKLYRIIGPTSNPAGSYWTTEIPTGMAEWRSNYAVLEEWNSNGQYVETVVGTGGQKVWLGETAAQDLGDGTYFSGGAKQIWMPANSVSPSSPIPTGW